jgi:hypothetical protein
MIFRTIHDYLLKAIDQKLRFTKQLQIDWDKSLVIIHQKINQKKQQSLLIEVLNKHNKIAKSINSRIFHLKCLETDIQNQKNEILEKFSLLEKELKNSKNIDKEQLAAESRSKLIKYLNYRLNRVLNDKKLYLIYRGTLFEEDANRSFNRDEFYIICNIYSITKKLIQWY